MPRPEPPLTGDALLEAVTDAMVALHTRYYHRARATAKTQLIRAEILACVMGGVLHRFADEPAEECPRVELLRTHRRRSSG